ncbi:hypothetical protein [Commensalibacter melissae]|uniref:hypothetical protein n=1 Tax=Commensalibacter melissae TaxID=2070537 RepID=UPI0012D8E63E|nr:hypothetical protein [Commensalibacter melissae]MUH05083.1 hypothetical protein [Commensalibacter melissae]
MKTEVQTSSLNWPQSDGKSVTCKEKLKILEENKTELKQFMQDVFEDALLIGVDEKFMRDFLKDMVDQLRSPVK